MTGEEHYAAAERLVDMVTSAEEGLITEGTFVANFLAAAQVHATLAIAHSSLPVLMTAEQFSPPMPPEVARRVRRSS